MMINPKKIIVSLDGMTLAESVKIACALKDKVWGFKINDLLYEKSSIINILKKYGKIFVDVKLFDIPNTVGNSVKKLSGQGVDIITVHASGGVDMMISAKMNAGKSKIVAVTVLTSQTINSKNKVIRLAQSALSAGVDGIVCSGREAGAIRNNKGFKKKLIIVPGVRPLWYKNVDDQKRIVTSRNALDGGVNLLVVGRPIICANNQIEALQRICRE
jgi:orotidine-5'-phosphate decarboxylase